MSDRALQIPTALLQEELARSLRQIGAILHYEAKHRKHGQGASLCVVLHIQCTIRVAMTEFFNSVGDLEILSCSSLSLSFSLHVAV